MEDLNVSTERILVELEFYKSENIRMKEEVDHLTEAALSEGGGDAVMKTRLATADAAMEERKQQAMVYI